MSSPPSIDICIVNYFGADDVGEALRLLGGWPHGRVFVVDNSADEAQAAALAAHPGIELLLSGENLGFGRGCNLAYAQSQAEFFLLLNPDARIAADDVRTLAELLREHPRIGAVSPRIWWNPQRSFVLPAAFPQTPLLAVAQNLASRSHMLTAAAARRYLAGQARLASALEPVEVDFLAGAVLMLRRSAVDAAGGLFDADYFMFYEDSDLSLRLRRGGSRLAVTAAADAVHEYRHKEFKGALMAQARQVYFRKCYPRFFRATDSLRRIDALARPVPLHDWFDVLPQPCCTLDDFNAQTRGASVQAFSPSPLTMPAIYRVADSTPFSSQEWDLLEPAAYTALLPDRQRWIHFHRM